MEKATIEHMTAQDFTKLIAESMSLNHTTSDEAFEWPAQLPSDKDTVFLEDIPRNATRGRLRYIAGNTAGRLKREVQRQLRRPIRKFRNLQVDFVAHPEYDDQVQARITVEVD